MTDPLPPGSTIGILGGGQLGRMLAQAAAKLGLRTHVYSDRADDPAFELAAAATCGEFTDVARIAAFAETVDVITYEFENVPLEAAEAAERLRPLRPGSRALAVAQDRLIEKRFISGLGLPVAPFAEVSSPAMLARELETIGTPAILKTRRFGYDGKGQARIRTPGEASAALAELAGAPAILEGHVAFEREVSILVVRGHDGEVRTYDTPVNEHRDGILYRSTVPSSLEPSHRARAEEIGRLVADALDYVGLLAVEMFHISGDAENPLIINEIAPRVHNSGHWTLDACHVSQFENHIRAVAGWPLGSTARHSNAVMTNLIGPEADDWRKLAEDPMLSLHLYGKREARAGRKMGHVTRLSPLTESGRANDAQAA
ncbi:MAG: 5-(carboxyamino)imidazole ribonucleotide synthase [Hyphomicrobiaceae bacterium]